VISAATTQLVNDYGGSIHANTFSTGGLYENDDLLLNAYGKYLNFIRVCHDSTILGNCWNSIGSSRFDTGVIYGDTSWWNNNYESAATLKDGSFFFVFLNRSELACIDSNGAAYTECARIYVDVNGHKIPNRIGKDIFEMNLHQTKIGLGSEYGSNENSTYGGIGFGMTGYCLLNKCPR